MHPVCVLQINIMAFIHQKDPTQINFPYEELLFWANIMSNENQLLMV